MPFPRGGSSFVVRELALRLPEFGWDVSLVSGSLGEPGSPGHAKTFFSGVNDLVCVDYSEALAAHERGEDAMAAVVPMHPSFEAKKGVADRVFAGVPPDTADHLVESWRKAFARTTQDPDVVHLHHLTPQYPVWIEQRKPIIGHLHGTELKFVSDARTQLGVPDAERDPEWRHAAFWFNFMTWAARSATALITVAREDAELARNLFELPEERIKVIENGVDTAMFQPLGREKPAEIWHNVLVCDPRGWDRTGKEGSIRYTDAQVNEAFFDRETGEPYPVLLCVCRFLRWKRIDDVIDAYDLARREHGVTAPLVLWGGYPGELEGTHPYDRVQERGVPDVFFTGWRTPETLSVAFRASTALINAAQSEPFGTAMIQALSSGLPVISTRAGGPLRYLVPDGPEANGWFFDPGDLSTLACLMAVACHDREARAKRSANATAIARVYGWDRAIEQVATCYEEALRSAGTRRSGHSSVHTPRTA